MSVIRTHPHQSTWLYSIQDLGEPLMRVDFNESNELIYGLPSYEVFYRNQGKWTGSSTQDVDPDRYETLAEAETAVRAYIDDTYSHLYPKYKHALTFGVDKVPVLRYLCTLWTYTKHYDVDWKEVFVVSSRDRKALRRALTVSTLDENVFPLTDFVVREEGSFTGLRNEGSFTGPFRVSYSFLPVLMVDNQYYHLSPVRLEGQAVMD